SLVLLLFLRALPDDAFVDEVRHDPRTRQRRWNLVALALGLGFSNHLSTAFVLPGLAYVYFAVHGFGQSAWRAIGRSAPFFLLGLVDYLYLPLRAAAWPAVSWGVITDPHTLFWHVSGHQYRGWMFSSLDVAMRQLGLFVRTLPSEFGYLALVPAAVGFFSLFKR